ncbi:MAG: pyruvate dehydrogenase complex dihydrolipoamide acetyltransferase [Alphaproteobacteria bacterium]|nr:pyruvate dehydrogenase complex dihydrolipoamide acetyltransferase [Alphaproteobacteria bacterium]
MPIKILMPALSPTMTEGNLSKWHKKEGDQVSAGDVIAEIETDKATMEVEAVDEGTLGKIMVPAGTKGVKVNSTIAVLLEDGEDKSAIKDEKEADIKDEEKTDASKKDTKKEEKESPEEVVEEKKPVEEPAKEEEKTEKVDVRNQRVNASPLAKKLGVESNIDLSSVQGSGPKGRIVKEDVLKIIGSGAGPAALSGHVQRITPESSEVPVSTMRSIIAKRLCESKKNIPHFYLSIDCNVDKLLEMRAEINGATDPKNPAYKISVNDLVIKATAKALDMVPEANTMWNEDSIIQHNNVDVAVAVAIDEGLVTPIIRNADQKTIFAISKEMKSLASKATSGTLMPEEFQGGSVTISNLGMYGIKQFNAIINPPQSCILSVGAARKEAGVKNGKIDIVNLMNITISCDHRVVDGAVAAMYINVIKDLIESPSRLLI